jgi:hypothetical protein
VLSVIELNVVGRALREAVLPLEPWLRTLDAFRLTTGNSVSNAWRASASAWR